MTARHDLIIIGAGIVGAACAAELARAGYRVLVLDRGPIGSGATAAGMGHIVIMDDSPAQLALTSYSRRLWRQLADDLPSATECDHCGTLWVAADDAEMAVVEQKRALLAEYDIFAEVLAAKELARAEPELRSGLAGGLRVPHDFVVYPPVAAAYLLEQAQAAGAELRIGCDVQHLDPSGVLRMADGALFEAPVIVVATGSWTSKLMPSVPVRPRKGHLVITDRYPGFVRHQLIELGYLKSAHTMQSESVAFNIQPRKTGQMLIGSSRQFDATGNDVEIQVVGKMLRRAQEYLPHVDRLLATRVWVGHRAATADKLPLIGPSPRHRQTWLATGHEGLGITTSLGTAQLLADQLAGRPSAIDATPYLPARYATEGAAHV